MGVVVSLLFVAAASSDLLQGLERKAYDLGVRAANRPPSDKVAVIAIDDQSIANLGRWPWPRDIQAQLLDTLAKAGTKVVGNTVFYTEPQVELAEMLVKKSFDGKVFFSNSGAEANECAVKLARKWARSTKGQDAGFDIIAFAWQVAPFRHFNNTRVVSELDTHQVEESFPKDTVGTIPRRPRSFPCICPDPAPRLANRRSS